MGVVVAPCSEQGRIAKRSTAAHPLTRDHLTGPQRIVMLVLEFKVHLTLGEVERNHGSCDLAAGLPATLHPATHEEHSEVRGALYLRESKGDQPTHDGGAGVFEPRLLEEMLLDHRQSFGQIARNAHHHATVTGTHVAPLA